VLVTGGTGFVGSHFVDAALAAGHDVTALVRAGTQGDHNDDRVNYIEHDFDQPEALAAIMTHQDVFAHFAWASDPVEGWCNPSIEVEANIRLSIELFEACVAAGVKKILFASSGGTVYGSYEGLICEDVVPRPFNPYGIGKLTVEHFLAYYQKRSGVDVDVYRIGNAYGPRQRVEKKQGVLPRWMDQIYRGEPVDVFGGEGTLRDYIHVQDVAVLMETGLNDLAASGTYNLGTGIGTSVLQLVQLLQENIDRPFEVHHAPRRESDNTSCILDARRILGRVPDFRFRQLADEIAPTWEAFKAARI
jgi:UDP-glucose 4-epimerase